MARFFALIVLLVLSFGLTADTTKALPPSGVQKVVADCQPSVFMITIEKKTATGFLVCRNPVLVVTTAHTVAKVEDPADIKVWTRLGKKKDARRVRAIHPHKGFKNDRTEKEAYSPDVALLELEMGPVLQEPLGLAAHAPNEDLRGHEIIGIGFPFYAAAGQEYKDAEAAVQVGIVRRVVGFDWSTKLPLSQRSMFELSFDQWPGDSGSPIISLSSGKVLGVSHGTNRRNLKRKGSEIETVLFQRSGAIHIREVWALLEQTKMKKLVN